MGIVVVGVSVGVVFSGMDEVYEMKNVEQENPKIKLPSCPFGVNQFRIQRHKIGGLDDSEGPEIVTSVALICGTREPSRFDHIRS